MSCTISKKKAGSAKYAVVAILKQGGKTYIGAKSKAAKPKPNTATFRSGKPNYKSYSYSTCNFIPAKMSLSGKTYTITGYACNNRIFRMQKYKKLTVTVYSGAKCIAKKTFNITQQEFPHPLQVAG